MTIPTASNGSSTPSPPPDTGACIERHFEQHVAGLLPGERTRERAALFLSVIAGFKLFRNVLGGAALVGADTATLSRSLEAVFQLLVEPTPDHSGGRRRATSD